MHTTQRDGDGAGGLLDGSATFDEPRRKALELRREGLSRRQIRDRWGVAEDDPEEAQPKDDAAEPRRWLSGLSASRCEERR